MSERLGFSKFALQVAIFLQFMLQFMQIAKQQVEQDNPREIRFLYTMITMQCTLFFLI